MASPSNNPVSSGSPSPIWKQLEEFKTQSVESLKGMAAKVQDFIKKNPNESLVICATAVSFYFTPYTAVLGLAIGFSSGKKIEVLTANVKEKMEKKVDSEEASTNTAITKEKAAAVAVGALGSLLVASRVAPYWLARAIPLLGTVAAGYALYQYTRDNEWTQKAQWANWQKS